MTSAVLHRGYNSCQKSCDTNAIARQNDAPLPPSLRCSVDCMDSSFFFFSAQSKLLKQRGKHQKQALTKTFASFKKKQNTNSFCKVCLRTYFPQGYQRYFQQSCSFVISLYSCKFVILINYLLILTSWCNKRFSMPRGVF